MRLCVQQRYHFPTSILDQVFLMFHLLCFPGSCWAVSVTDAIAAAHAILASSTRAPAINYSQLLMTASSNPNDPCGGGNPWNAFRILSNASSTGGGLKANVSDTLSTNAVTHSNLPRWKLPLHVAGAAMHSISFSLRFFSMRSSHTVHCLCFTSILCYIVFPSPLIM